MKKLTNKQKETIDLSVNDRMEDLEDCINMQLREMLDELGIKNDEAIVFARKVFYNNSEVISSK